MSNEKEIVMQEATPTTFANTESAISRAADLSKTQDVTTVTEVSTINSTDQFYMNQAGKFVQVDYNQLATAILNLITSKTFTLDQGTKTLIDAIDELNSKSQIRLAYMGTATFTDFNDCPRNTAWWIDPSTVTGNSPDAQFGVLESVGVLQRFTTIYGGYEIYTRVYANGDWNDWQKFIPAS